MAERPQMLNQQATAYVRTDILDTHVNAMSIPTLWEKSYLCPCRHKATRQPNQSCKLCHGRGIAYMPPKPVQVIIQSQEKGANNLDIGLLDAGTAIGTPERDFQIAFRDRITLSIAQVSQSYIFDVSERRIEKGFPMIYDVHSIDFATTIKGQIFEGEDFEFDKTNNIFYPKEHLLNENVSINIQTSLRYMVADLLKEHRYHKDGTGTLQKTPQKLLLKREDLFIDKESFEIGVDDPEVGEMIETKRQPPVDGLNGFFRGGGL